MKKKETIFAMRRKKAVPLSFTQNILNFATSLHVFLSTEMNSAAFAETLASSKSEKPTNLMDFAHLTSSLLDPSFVEKAFAILNVSPRQALSFEVRPSRLLKSPSRMECLEMVFTDFLHMRPASFLCGLMKDHPGTILWVERDVGNQSAILQRCVASITALMLLKFKKGEKARFKAEGERAHELLDRLKDLNDRGWNALSPDLEIRVPFFIDRLDAKNILDNAKAAMDVFGTNEVCGVFDGSSRRLYFGHPTWGHCGTAQKANVLEYGRIDLRRTATGEVSYSFPEYILGEDLGGYYELKKILETR